MFLPRKQLGIKVNNVAGQLYTFLMYKMLTQLDIVTKGRLDWVASHALTQHHQPQMIMLAPRCGLKGVGGDRRIHVGSSPTLFSPTLAEFFPRLADFSLIR